MSCLTIRRLSFYRLSSRSLSTAAAAVASSTASKPSSSAPSRRLPIRHSRNQLPRIVNDPIQLTEWTREILETPVGSLFTYNQVSNSISTSGLPKQDAWQQADATVQRVECLLRGHAHTVPGTQWNRWLPRDNESMNDAEVDTRLETMQALLDRLEQEGHTYMTLYAARMEELHGPKQLDMEEETDIPELEMDGKDLQTDMEEFAKQEGLELYLSSGSNQEDGDEENNEDEDYEDEDYEIAELSYMNDFSLPGPTVAMYDTLLDTMACAAPHSTSFVTPTAALEQFQIIMGRHQLDGDDFGNTNVHTLPTVLSYNAPIRISASLPFDATQKDSETLQARDQALEVALGCFDALRASSLLHRNSASYTYLLGTLHRYLPESRMRENMARGLLHHAGTLGVVNDAVLQAYKQHDEDFTKTKQDLPAKWIRHSKARRYHPREATY